MAKGIFAADPCDGNGVPDFVAIPRRVNLRALIPGRLWQYTLSGRSQYLHILRLRDAADVPITITAQNRCVYWVSGSNITAARARRILKFLRNNAWRTATMAELIADNTAAALTVKASPDLTRPLTFDAVGNVLTTETGLMHDVYGFLHPPAADATTAAEIDGATPEAP